MHNNIEQEIFKFNLFKIIFITHTDVLIVEYEHSV